MIPKDLWEDVRWGRRSINEVREIIGRAEDQTHSPSRAIITRDAVRELARQLDPPNDCPACRGGDAQHNAYLIEERDALVYLDQTALIYEGYDHNGEYSDWSVQVTYCPKCGRKLEAKP